MTERFYFTGYLEERVRTMAIEVSNNDGKAVLSLPETFDFNCVEAFRKSYEGISIPGLRTLVIDLRSTEYMDSSALGMLIQMQKHFEGKVTDFKIVNCRANIKKVLSISRFDRRFDID